jgi:hypothetical protein
MATYDIECHFSTKSAERCGITRSENYPKGKQKMQQIEIRLKGQINQQWSEWLGGLTVDHSDPDETILSGSVPDQAALYGIIARLRDLGLPLFSLHSEEIEEN